MRFISNSLRIRLFHGCLIGKVCRSACCRL